MREISKTLSHSTALVWPGGWFFLWNACHTSTSTSMRRDDPLPLLQPPRRPSPWPSTITFVHDPVVLRGGMMSPICQFCSLQSASESASATATAPGCHSQTPPCWVKSRHTFHPSSSNSLSRLDDHAKLPSGIWFWVLLCALTERAKTNNCHD